MELFSDIGSCIVWESGNPPTIHNKVMNLDIGSLSLVVVSYLNP